MVSLLNIIEIGELITWRTNYIESNGKKSANIAETKVLKSDLADEKNLEKNQ